MPEITDEVAERLFRSLEMMEVAAGGTQVPCRW